MKETGPTGRAEEIVESKIESWIPISYAVRHKGRHSSLPLPSALPLVPPPAAAASRIHHVSCTPQPEPPSPAQLALCPLSPPSSRALQFRDHTDGAAGGGRARSAMASTTTKSAVYIQCWRRRWRRGRLRLARGSASHSSRAVFCANIACWGWMAVADKHDNDDDMHAVGRGGMCSVRVGGCLDERGKEGLANTE